jgi:protein-S-isoprenylcysteine O-methyltransferase Ste14
MLYRWLRDIIHPSTTRSLAALFLKSVLNAAVFFTIFMIGLPWLAHRLLPYALPLPAGLRLSAAGALGVTGAAMWLTCLVSFSCYGRGTPFAPDAPRYLVTHGLFSCTRNPIMAGELLVIWAEALYFASVGIVLYAVTISVVAHLLVVRVEEPELRDRFGARYEAYCRKVPRWLPRLYRPHSARRSSE